MSYKQAPLLCRPLLDLGEHLYPPNQHVSCEYNTSNAIRKLRLSPEMLNNPECLSTSSSTTLLISLIPCAKPRSELKICLRPAYKLHLSILSIAYAPNHPHVRQLAKSCYQRNVNATTSPRCEYTSTTRTARMPEKGRDLN